jgi:TonB-linked SusC/RagA family outer membrane protein
MTKLLAYLLCFCLAASQVYAQSRTATGTVTDEKGIPLAAVTVTALTSDRKVISTSVTDNTGSFKIGITERTRNLQFTYIGLEEWMQPVGGKTSFAIVLHANNRNLSEVVVVGYGSQKKAEVTGSVASVKGSAISETPVQSFDAGLAGRSAGVQITSPSGVVNETPVFRIRGTNSISLSSYPLVIIDGVPSFTGDLSANPLTGSGISSAAANPLASLNPNDIESIDIAKDAAATAIYGSRASNGVVFITTKKGKAGKARISYDGWVGNTKGYGLPKMLDASQYIQLKSLAVANNPGQSAVTFNYAKDAKGNNVNTNWGDYVYRTGFSQSHNINISGGNDATTYYLSSGYTVQEGLIRKNDFKRANILANVDSRVNKYLTLGGKISFSNEQNLAAGSSGSLPGEAYNTGALSRITQVLPSILAPYNNDGTYNINGSGAGSPNITGTTISYPNPVPLIDKNRSNNEVNHIQSSVYAQVKPLSWITLKTMYGIDYLLINYDVFLTGITGDGYTPNGSVTASNGNFKTWLWTNTAQFDYTFGAKHNFSLLVGNEQQRRTSATYGINRTGVSDPNYNIVQAGYTINNPASNAKGENYLLSTFGRLNYNFDKKYYLAATLRQDEYSALGQKKGVFWGGSAGWEIAQEQFWKTSHLDHVFSSFKIRGSYGKVGNINGINDYTPYNQYVSGLYGGSPTLSFPLGSVGNNNLKWETSKQMDIGFNFGILNDRITGQAAYYNNDVNGLILFVNQAPSTGIPTASAAGPPLNVGSMYNRGVELNITATPVQTKAFTWTTGFNITYNTNKVTALYGGLPNIQTSTSGLETVNLTQPGYALGYLWVIPTAGVDPGTGKRIFKSGDGQKVYYQYSVPSGQFQYSTTPDGKTKYVSKTGGTSITQAADAVLYKNPLPKYVGGWSNTFNYKGFTLDVLLTYQAGFYVYYGTDAGLHDQRFWNNATDMLAGSAWLAPGETGKKWARPVFNDNVSNGSAMPMDINVFKGDFVKLRNVSLSYSLPGYLLQRIGLSSARVYVTGQNLAIFSKYPGPDPEVSSNGNSTSGQGVDRNTTPNARTITVGLNLGL